MDANNIPSGSMIPTLKIGDFLFVNQMRYKLRIPFTDIILLSIDRPKRGDIVTFIPPQDEFLAGKVLVKRIIGMPGDVIAVSNNEITVSGTPYPTNIETNRTILADLDYPPSQSGQTMNDYSLHKEKIIQPNTQQTIVEHYILKETMRQYGFSSSINTDNRQWVIPKNKYMMMGDNRDNSDDSRRWGLLDISQIHGKVFMIYFSINWGERFKNIYDSRSSYPFFNLFKWLFGDYPNVYIRWDRIGHRIL